MRAAAPVDEAERLLDGVEPTCEYRSAGGALTCSAEASWLLRVSCGDSAFFCDGHKATMSRGALGTERVLYCAGHDGRRVIYDWVAL